MTVAILVEMGSIYNKGSKCRKCSSPTCIPDPLLHCELLQQIQNEIIILTDLHTQGGCLLSIRERKTPIKEC